MKRKLKETSALLRRQYWSSKITGHGSHKKTLCTQQNTDETKEWIMK